MNEAPRHVVGLIGADIAPSLSPALHEREADELGLRYVTELLRHARPLGCRTLDGAAMAVFQAALSFTLFTGIEPNRERVPRHFAQLAEDNPAGAASAPLLASPRASLDSNTEERP
jgi:shikimate dehydrogenase